MSEWLLEWEARVRKSSKYEKMSETHSLWNHLKTQRWNDHRFLFLVKISSERGRLPDTQAVWTWATDVIRMRWTQWTPGDLWRCHQWTRSESLDWMLFVTDQGSTSRKHRQWSMNESYLTSLMLDWMLVSPLSLLLYTGWERVAKVERSTSNMPL